ncbi:MAG: maltose alpha-D-glucosyltransferase [Alphaproteobacteria bacterium]|nr:maltose alpha-D-glucosyltransferase [Alphaproteobacteria bacterium]
MKKKAGGRAAADPLWYKDAVIYQLHLKSFFDSNNDGIGDFRGLISKLDYIAEIGVTAIWLLPFYPSPRRDDGYDISEYREVHPEFGKLGDARRFIEEAHKRGLKVITELVINHTSDQHRWFQRARKAKPDSALRDFYVWSDTDKKYAGTRIIFVDSEKSNWTWDEEANAYYWHRFYAHQPDLNFDNPQVLKAMLSVIRFWADLGVDGFRLDAVPYLVEREGTSNENLPETHAILKRVRQELEQHYPDRMLLAEANQWPEDVQAYFGSGDECHMAFHFPLMPRMYMAIAQEDRFPITDIMRQTPDIPDSCQWAIFLRNHDELTLEMVTDKERDYLWKVYASDARARLNLGIRRRLAPLLERDRRRIELMKSLLLSMPGTPVIYYGDEIGMGDNVHLGDRDGVRTPMQWSSDRNGGFSRADPASLVLPAIMDPLYGYEAVNVEAQWRDPHSLLNWFRRMLLVRRQHKAFGRGSIRFLRPQNRKVLAYLRKYEDETILCVANVSRTAQAVELDLAEFNGRTPVELSGSSAFPMIGQLTYLLTLPPYGFYWFLLSQEAQQPAWSTSTSGTIVEHHTFVLREGIEEIAKPAALAVLEEEVLPQYIPARRWFQHKDRKISGIKFAECGKLSDDMLYSEIDVRLGNRNVCYTLPLAIAWEGAANAPFEVPLALSRVRRGRRVGYLTDSFANPAFAHAMIDFMKAGRAVQAGHCRLEFAGTSALASLALAPNEEVVWPGAEQTNSTLIVGRKAVLKLFRRVNAGVHPEAEMTRYLTEHAFKGTPALFSEAIRVNEKGARATVAVLQAFLPNQGDGWAWTLQVLDRLVDEGATPYAESSEPGFESYSAFVRVLGQRLGEMHKVLAEPSDDPAFAPKVIDTAGTAELEARARREIEHAYEAIETLRLQDEKDQALVRTLKARRAGLLAQVRRLAAKGEGRPATRIHGDMHLGQVLLSGADVAIVDFEGEPSKSLEERRAKTSPLRDLAGMIRSFDYAAATVERNAKQAEGGDGTTRAHALLARFRLQAEIALLEGYRDGSGHSLSDAEFDLLRLFMIEKAAFEVGYEAANRPDWIATPLAGLVALTEKLAKRPESVLA